KLMASFCSVSDLKPFKTMWKIRVRIIRLWKQYSAAGGLTIEMVVVDSNGVKIHASVKKDLKVLHVPNDTIDDEDDENSIIFSYYCPKCKVSNPKLLPRYKLHLIVVDSSGKSKFLLLDNLAVELIHQPCISLAGPNADEDSKHRFLKS
ncbi:hypothetical protein HID58_047333, partial [Brassica napus]